MIKALYDKPRCADNATLEIFDLCCAAVAMLEAANAKIADHADRINAHAGTIAELRTRLAAYEDAEESGRLVRLRPVRSPNNAGTDMPEKCPGYCPSGEGWASNPWVWVDEFKRISKEEAGKWSSE